ncbi:starch-binding protein [Sungkyunkwania multivorans]|uniref:Starch-binding protein n=1 Tax=Sungkyunkwania multivorans TaxID=1173618 RepID=A0ABW3CVJ9_9FLAO
MNPLAKTLQRTITFSQALLLVASSFFFSYSYAQTPNDDRVLLQGFYWEAAANNPGDWYNIVNAMSTEISNMGIDMIWLPPPSDAGSLEGYLPRELNNFSNSYGNLQEHTAMLSALNSKGIEPIADIVINHRVGNTNWVDFMNPQWGTNSITNNDEVWSQPEYSNVFPRGNGDTGTPYEAARDIDHTQTYVRQSIKDFLNNLKAIGYKGWRYDFVHGFDTSYFTEYNNATSPTYSVGENYNSNKQVVQDWIDATGSNAFDFPTYFTLKASIRDNNYSYLATNGQASGGIGWDPRNYTTFVENHDTPRYDTPNNVLNGNNVGQTYAYLLTHPGVPCIYWPHLFDWGNGVKQQIVDLIGVRKAAGIHSQSALEIVTAENGRYAAIVSGDNHRIAVKMGPDNWSPQGNWQLVASGNNYAVWKEGNIPPPSSFTVYAYNYTTAYTWNDQQQATSGGWPGTNMTSDGGNWYRTTVPGDCTNIIFSNNGAGQTADLVACKEAPYYYEGQFYADKPGTGGNSVTLYVRNKSHAYTWANNQPTSGGWPGTQMQSLGNGWRSFTLNGAACTNIIFSNNGGNQTQDLYGCNNKPYYYNNRWNTNPPSSFPSAARSLNNDSSLQLTKPALSPNPFKETATLSLEVAKERSDVQVQLTNSMGTSTMIYQGTLAKGKHRITLDMRSRRLRKGIYVCNVMVDGMMTTTKLVKH